MEAHQSRFDRLRRSVRAAVRQTLWPLLRGAARASSWMLPLAGLLLPCLFLLAWGLYAGYRFGLAALKVLVRRSCGRTNSHIT